MTGSTAAPRPIAEIAGARPGWAPRLVAIDVDGTILTSEHRVQEATVQSVARARRRGIEIVLATSRGPCATWPVLRELGLVAPAVFVGSQGGVTGQCTADGELVTLDRRPMRLDLVRPVLAAATREGIAVSWYAGGEWLVSSIDATIEHESRVVRVQPSLRDLAAESVEPEKLMLIAPTSDVEPLRRIAAALPAGLRAQVSNPTYLEITRDDVDKAHAVRDYCASSGIDARAVVAIGDGPNDLGLFAVAGGTIAPANARPEVLAAADFVTASNDEGGVARALDVLAGETDPGRR